MLKNATGLRHIWIKAGYTDMRKGITGLSVCIILNFGMDPFEEDTLWLFCGRNRSTIKGLVWEGDGFCMLTKHVQSGSYLWPRTTDEIKELSREQFQRLMEGFTVESSIKVVKPIQESRINKR